MILLKTHHSEFIVTGWNSLTEFVDMESVILSFESVCHFDTFYCQAGKKKEAFVQQVLQLT